MQKAHRLDALRDKLSQEVPAQSLAAFRILFGALIFWDFWRFILHDRIWRYWVAPDFHFSYAGFSWVKAPPEPGFTSLGPRLESPRFWWPWDWPIAWRSSR